MRNILFPHLHSQDLMRTRVLAGLLERRSQVKGSREVIGDFLHLQGPASPPARSGSSRLRRYVRLIPRQKSLRLITAGGSVEKRLLGGWTSILLYRKPLMCIFRHAYSPARSKVVALPRSVADELVLVSALVPVITSNLGAAWSEDIFASGSSDFGAVFVSAPASASLTSVRWRASEKRRPVVLAREEAALKRLDLSWEELPADAGRRGLA